MLRKEKTPGPGSYNLNVRPITPTPPAYTIAPKANAGQGGMESPGPGAYYPDTGRSSPAFSIHGKISKLDREKAGVPGPGSYYADTQVTQPSDPAYTMGSRKISFPRALSPGPGQYTVPSMISTGPSYTMSGKRQPYGQADNPGPGAYSPGNRPTSPCYTMGYRTGGKAVHSQTPGPGSYRPTDGAHGPAYSMAIRKADRVERGPGPGQYQLDSGLAQGHHREPAYTMLGRLTPKKRDQSPGPGAYNAEKRSTSPKYSLGGKRTDMSGKNTPGPGAYEQNRSPSAPAYTMGLRPLRTPRFTGPGPGSYSPRQEPGGPAFSILQKKLGGSKKNTPGPGEYNQKRVTDPAAPAYSIGRRLDKEMERRNQCPGPGQYRPRHQDGGPKYSMHSGTQRFNYY